ncbi:MAG: thymidylate kinase [Candidatus Sulfotelmatobacter sp.]|jgi:thymidylate kinase
MRLNNARVISFSGIDGAGKSTQIEAVQCYFRELGLRFSVYTFWDDVVVFSRFRERVSLKAFRGEKGVGSPDQPISRRDKNVTSWYVTVVRLLLYLMDACSLRAAVSRCCNADVDFILFDRYIYDELANLPLNHWLLLLYVRLLLMVAPRPDLAFVVDADPETAHARKPEYPLEFVRKNRAAYIALSRLVQGMTVLEPFPIEETTAKINESITRKFLQTDVGAAGLPSHCRASARQSKMSSS